MYLIIEQAQDKRVARDDELSDSEDEGDDRHDEASYRDPSDKKKPRIVKDDDSLKTAASTTLAPSPALSATSSAGGGEGHAPPSDQPSLVKGISSVTAQPGHSNPDNSGTEMDITRYDSLSNFCRFIYFLTNL